MKRERQHHDDLSELEQGAGPPPGWRHLLNEVEREQGVDPTLWRERKRNYRTG